jgi:hypothetical protein
MLAGSAATLRADEELLPRPVPIEEVLPAPMLEEPCCDSRPTPLGKVNILQNLLFGEDDGSIRSWSGSDGFQPSWQIGYWTQNMIKVVGPVLVDRSFEASPTRRDWGATATPIPAIPDGPTLDFGPFPPTCVRDSKPLGADNHFNWSVNFDILRYAASFPWRIRGFSDEWDGRPDESSLTHPDYATMHWTPGNRAPVLDRDGKSLPGQVYRWVASDSRWDWIDGGTTIVFRQSRPDECDLYFVMTVVRDKTTPDALSGRVRLQHEPTENRWRIIHDVAEEPSRLDTLFGPNAEATVAKSDEEFDQHFEGVVIRYLVEGPTARKVGQPTPPPSDDS